MINPFDKLRQFSALMHQQEADPKFANKVEKAGFPSLTAAIATARKWYERSQDEKRKAGPLLYATALYEDFKKQVEQNNEIVFSFNDLPGRTKEERYMNLGRARALARLAALQKGCRIPQLEGNNPKFTIRVQSALENDTWGSRYEAACQRLVGPFWNLEPSIQKQLIGLAKRSKRN